MVPITPKSIYCRIKEMRLASLVAGLVVTVSGTLLAQPIITTDPSQLFGTAGQTYNKQLAATGGSGQYQWSLVTGNLPPVLSLKPDTGVIAGIPNSGGTSSFTIKVLDLATAQSSAKQLSIGILQISTPSPLPDATLNTPYSVTFGVTDGPPVTYIWQLISAGNPPGLNFSSQGVLSGTPTAAGPYNFTVMASEPGGTSATKSFTLNVSAAGAITITTPFLPGGNVNAPYQATLAATGGKPPYHWTVATGALPDGLVLDPNTGTISGTPSSPGPSSFTIVAIDSANNGSAPKLFSITINPALAITNSSPLQSGTVGSVFSLTFVAVGGATPYSFTSQASPFNPNPLPPGLTLSTAGVLSGTPTMQGTYNFTIAVTDATGMQVSKPFTQTINPALTFQTPAQLPAGMIGVNYSQTITATGGTPPYVYTAANPPPGLTLLGSANVGAVLSGTPTAIGTFPFDVVVTDNQKVSKTQTFQLSVTAAPPMLTVVPLSLDFAAAADGDSPASQKIDINSVGPQPAAFNVVIDGGASGIAAPPWLSVNLRSGLTPSRVVVSVDQARMTAGKYSARIRIIDASQNTMLVLVSLTVSNVAPKLEVVPDVLNFSALIEAPGTFEQVLAVRNAGGGGPLSFSTSVLGGSSWVTTVTPGSGQTARNTLVFLRVRVSTAGVAIGSYHEFISFTWAGGTVNVPITLFVADRGPILGVNITGVRLQARQGGGFSNIPVVKVLNLGDPSTTVNWLAELVTGSDFLTLGPARGTASATNPGLLTIVPKPGATQMAPGGYYALIRISDPQSRNSPAYVIVVFDLANAAAPPLPDPSPAGLFFIGAANGAPPAGQIVAVNTSSATAVPFQVAALTADGTNWLNANPSTGTSTGQSPGQITVVVKTTGLAPGIYIGEVTISMSGALRTVMVTLIVLPAGSAVPSTTPDSGASPSAACTPSQLALTQIGLVNSFSQPASWPAALIAQLNDDCGALVDNGSVVASFSNGDSPLTLRRAGQPGMYAATWQPGVVSPQMAITIRAVAGALQPASIQLIGHIDPNSAPVLFKNGTVNVFNRVTAGALSPGMIVEVYGSGLASATANPGMLPLPNIFNNTYVLVGPYQAPLYFLSDGQLDVQINTELTPTQQFPIVVSANGRLTLPDMLDVVPVQLGIAHFDDGHVIAQHGADFSYVDAAHPAKPNEVLVIYLSGMGATDPSVKSGDPSPVTEPLARVTLKPTVMVDGQEASVQFAGLTPGFVGLYQMNFQVPANAKSGDLNLVVIQNGVSSNTTKLAVAQ